MFDGGCHCGAVRYRLDTDALPPIYACHCNDCQTFSGSAFAMNALVLQSAIAFTGQTICYDPTGGGGLRHYLCGRCHTRLYDINRAAPGLVILHVGTLDHRDGLRASAHIWTKRKQPWVILDDDAPRWPENPTAEDFARLVTR